MRLNHHSNIERVKRSSSRRMLALTFPTAFLICYATACGSGTDPNGGLIGDGTGTTATGATTTGASSASAGASTTLPTTSSKAGATATGSAVTGAGTPPTTTTGAPTGAVVATGGMTGMAGSANTAMAGATMQGGAGGVATEPMAGSGGTSDGGASTGGSTMTNGGTPSFSTPEGTIPNSPQPSSTVNLSQQQWASGLISPTMLQGHQINQPSVVNGYLVIGGNEDFWIYDVSDPTTPKELSNFSTPGATGGEAESHTVSFARYGDEYYMVTIGGRGVDTWDVTNPNGPQHLDAISIPGTNYGDYTEAVWGVSWQGQYIYVGATNNGIKIVDASNPSDLSIAGEISTSQYGGVSAGPVDAIGNVLVVTTPKESGGIATLDISDPTNPTRLASFTTSISYIGMFYRRWVFLITPLRAWDVLTDPRNIGSGNSPVGTMQHGGAEYMSFSDDYLFLGHVRTEIGGTPGASKITVANLANMRVESTIWGRLNLGGVNDDQFTIPIGNLLVIGDDQAPYAGWVIGVHQPDPDTTPPEVDTVIPKDQEAGVATTSRIGITFSDNIELATVNTASFIVRPVGGQPLSGKFGLRMGVVNFDPDEDLQPGTTYEVVLPQGGIADLVGNTLTTEWKSTFTTE